MDDFNFGVFQRRPKRCLDQFIVKYWNHLTLFVNLLSYLTCIQTRCELVHSPSKQGIKKLDFCVNQSIIICLNDANWSFYTCYNYVFFYLCFLKHLSFWSVDTRLKCRESQCIILYIKRWQWCATYTFKCLCMIWTCQQSPDAGKRNDYISGRLHLLHQMEVFQT